MKKIWKYGASIVLSLLIGLLLFPGVAVAEGPIETDREVEFTLHYSDDAKGIVIPDARFSVYRVADVDIYGTFTFTDEFSGYPVRWDNLNQAGWAALAETLKGYVMRDGLTPVDTGKTDEDGLVTFPSPRKSMKPGLFLVLGEPINVDGQSYFAAPFMMALPIRSETANEWEYSVFSQVKCEIKTFRNVLKIWDDDGFESIRPKEIEVQLLRDGQLEDTVILNERNSWRHSWEELDPASDWVVVETAIKNYYVTVERVGVTYTITNKYIAPVLVDPPVSKVVKGSPPKDSEFTFILAAQNPDNPMPEGAVNGVKTATVVGTGVTEFGEIKFTEGGTYVYSVSEKQESIDGYSFDKTVYILTFEVTEENGELSIARTIRTGAGDAVENLVFTNEYYKPGIPRTGLYWWPVPVLAGLGIAFITIGYLRRKKSVYGE